MLTYKLRVNIYVKTPHVFFWLSFFGALKYPNEDVDRSTLWLYVSSIKFPQILYH